MNLLRKYQYATYLIFVFLLFMLHQMYFIFIGGTTWDEYGSVMNASKQVYKLYLFLVDFNNPALIQELSPPEHYGGLLFIPALLATFSESVMNIFSRLLSSFEQINTSNKIEVALIVRHIVLNFYIVSILAIFFNQLKKIYSKKFSLTFVVILILIPSINGHGLFNFTDIPFALQFFLASIIYLKFINVNTYNINIFIGFVFGLALLTRFNSIVFLASLSFFDLFLNLKKKQKYDFGNFYKPFFIKNITIYLTSFVVLFLGTPTGWKTPVKWIQGAYKYQFKQENETPTMFNGEVLYSHKTRADYLIDWLFVRTPIVIIVMLIVSIFLFGLVKQYRNIYNFFAVYFLFFVLISFMLYRPVSYDGIRHYLFLFPFIVLLSTDALFYFFEKKKLLLNVSIISIILLLVYTQSGLGPYKYVYFNEFVEEDLITFECEEVISQSGCGNWHTDYWGFGGKELYKISKNYESKVLYFCVPHHVYSFYQENNNPWNFNRGNFEFDDQFPFTQQEYFYYNSDMLKHINSPEFKEIEFISLNYHRPPLDSCGLTELDKNIFEIDCKVIDGVRANLRNKEIWMNYLYECSVEKLNT